VKHCVTHFNQHGPDAAEIRCSGACPGRPISRVKKKNNAYRIERQDCPLVKGLL
jgi:hypothetical protein